MTTTDNCPTRRYTNIPLGTKDRSGQDYADDQSAARIEERKSFKELLDTEKKDVNDILEQQKNDVKGILTQDEKHFEQMMANSLNAQRHENAAFTAVLASEKQLFENEEQLFQSLNGQLLPANDPMPSTGCGLPAKDQYIVSINGGGHMFRKFPHTVLLLNGYKTVWLDKKKDGTIALFLDIRDDTERIALRVDKDGFFVNPHATLFARRPDKSSLVIQNDLGADLISVRYANPQAFVVTGQLANLGIGIDCIEGDSSSEILIETGRPKQPPPKQP
jgi:hypothetical protein